MLGELRPYPGRYCTLALTLGPADDDAEGADENPDMVGYTLAIEADGQPVATLGGTRTIELTLSPLALSENDRQRTHELTIELDTATWLAGIDPKMLDAPSAHVRLFDNIAASATLLP